MNADTMDRSEVVSSAASGSVGFTRTQTHDDNTLSGEEGTLDLVEDAILQTLKRYSSKQHHHGSQGNARRSRGRRHNNVDDDDEEEDDDQCSSPSVNAPLPRSTNPDDMEVLSHLLQQVTPVPALSIDCSFHRSHECKLQCLHESLCMNRGLNMLGSGYEEGSEAR